MPTALPRFQVTQTPEVEDALRKAAAEWPGVKRHELVSRLLAEGAAAVESRRGESRRLRRERIARTQGIFAYDRGYLEDLRSEWDD